MKRKPYTIKNLAAKITREIHPDSDGQRCIRLCRNWSLDPACGLTASTEDEVVTLHERVCRAIPDDFNFFLTLGDDGVDGSLEYDDGLMGSFGLGFPVNLDRHFLENLRNIDWDEIRGDGLNMIQEIEPEVSGPVPDWFKEHIAATRGQR